VAGVNALRRIEIGGVLVLAAAAMLLGAMVSVAGLELPPAVTQALSGAVDVLGCVRWLIVAVLVFGVLRAREDPV
jgi:hypothetical protein